MRHLALARFGALAAALLTPATALAKASEVGLASPPTSDYEITEAAAALRPNQYLWTDVAAQGPVSVLISLPDQRAYVFRGEKMIAAAAVSTGSDGKPTPTGTFTILQKKEMHRSNLYDDAPMPYMQRLTWDGVAMHAGRNPGFPASHGCVRLPGQFAKRLFAATDMGATVEVTDEAYVAGFVPVSDARRVAEANALRLADAKEVKAANKAAKRDLASTD